MPKIVLVAVDIRSVHNVGAFFRTCDGFGAELVLSGITPRPSGGDNDGRLPHIRSKMDEAIAKTALGAEKTVPWQYYPDVDTAVAQLRSNGYTIAAVEQAPNSQPIQQLQPKSDIALLVGPEVTGLPSAVLKQCDSVYEIPMSGSKESFNVSIAAGIALYQASNT